MTRGMPPTLISVGRPFTVIQEPTWIGGAAEVLGVGDLDLHTLPRTSSSDLRADAARGRRWTTDAWHR